MTKTQINYSTLPVLARSGKALADIADYLGEDRMLSFEADFRQVHKRKPVSFQRFETLCSIAGISGYPVEVWYEYLTTMETVS
jgi:hypothetical protein